MEYFEVLDRLEEIIRDMDLDLDIDASLSRARQDTGLSDQEALSVEDFSQLMDRVIGDLRGADTSQDASDSDTSTPKKFEELLAESLQEVKERMVVYWQNVDGPGHVVFDPFGVAGDNR